MFDSTLHTSLRSGFRQSSSRSNIYLRSFVMAIMYWCAVIKFLIHWSRQTLLFCFLERLKMAGDSDIPILFKVLYLKKVIVQLV